MPPQHNNTLEEILRLTKENNQMLHSMRRSAFLGGVLKVVVYLAFLIVPYWLYLQYLAPQISQILDTMQKVQGTGASAQVQMAEWQKTLEDLRSKIPGLTPKQ